MKKLYYEAKCRRCGNKILYSGINQMDFTKEQITEWKHEKITYPFLENCDECQVETVQDIISFIEQDKQF